MYSARVGVLPLRLPVGINSRSLARTPRDEIEVLADEASLAPRGKVSVRIARASGDVLSFGATAAIETSLEITILRAGGISPLIVQRALN